jgi:hypothetical protein
MNQKKLLKNIWKTLATIEPPPNSMELNKEENFCHNRDHATHRVLTLLCCRWDSQLSASGATPRALAKAFCAAADTWCFLFFFSRGTRFETKDSY